MAAPSITDLGLEEAERLGFESKEAFIDEAVNTYFASRKDKRVELAVVLYEGGKVSLGRAAEIASLDIEALKKELDERDIERRTGSVDEGADRSQAYRERNT